MQLLVSSLVLCFLLPLSSGKGLECAVCQQFVEEIDKEEIKADQNLKKVGH